MIRSAVTALLIALFAVSAHGEALKSEQDAKRLSEQVMAAAAKGDLSAAFELMKPHVVIPETELQSSALQSKAQRDQFGARFGKPVGYEFISEKKAGSSILRLIYIEKTPEHALPWIFFYYKKPDNTWVLNSFVWSDQIQNVYMP